MRYQFKLNTMGPFTGRIICVYFFCIKGHVALDRNLGPRYDTLLLRLIPGDLQSACPLIHTLPGLLDSRAALSNSYPNSCVPSREAVCTHFMVVFGMTKQGANCLHTTLRRAFIHLFIDSFVCHSTFILY